MGRVYKARDRELDKLIALKTIRLDTAEGPDALARFKQELLLARKVTHRNVVRIFDLGEAEGIKFFTMEYIEGESLKALIRRQGPLPVSQVVPLARQILARARGGPLAGHHPPRPEAAEHHGRGGHGHGPPDGLRDRARHRRHRHDRDRRDRGHARLHVARAGEGRARRESRPTSSPSA